MRRAGTLVALALFCCSKPEPVFHCAKQPAATGIRSCWVQLPDGYKGETFERKEAHCFRGGPQLWCAPDERECEAYRVSARSANETLGVCRLTRADEVPTS